MGKKANSLALSVWFPNTPGLSSKLCLHPHSNTVRRPTTANTQSNKRFTAWIGKTIPESFLALSWPKRLPRNLQQSQNVSVNTSHNMGKKTVRPGQQSHWEDLHRPKMGKENQSPNLCMREIYTRSQYMDGNTPDTTLWKKRMTVEMAPPLLAA